MVENLAATCVLIYKLQVDGQSNLGSKKCPQVALTIHVELRTRNINLPKASKYTEHRIPMKWTTDISIFLHIATIGICFLLGAVIAGKKGYYQKANYYLILLLVVTIIVHTNAFLILSGYKQVNLHFQNMQNAFGLLFGPALYFTTLLRLPDPGQSKYRLYHFIPFFLLLPLVLLYYLQIIPKSIWSVAELIALIFFMLQLPFYILITFLLIREKQHPFFKTLRILLIGLFLLYLVQVGIISYKIFIEDIPNTITLNASLFFSFCVIYFAYKSLANDNILFDRPKYIASALTDQQANTMVEKLKQLMKEERLFLQPQLKIGDVASKLETTSKYLSQAINDGLGKNFYEFINEYRVEHVKGLLKDHNNHRFTLLALAQQAGFKSGSTFNTAFKKYVGMLPSTYRKKYAG